MKGIWLDDQFKSGIYTSKDQELSKHAEGGGGESLEETIDASIASMTHPTEPDALVIGDNAGDKHLYSLREESPDSGFDAPSPDMESLKL